MAFQYENICRLCLQKNVQTVYYSMNRNVGATNVTVTEILRSFIPELYLELSQSPLVCSQCFIIIESFQKFKQKCLEGEYLIGVYLRETKCTDTLIRLSDVISFWEEKNCTKKVENIIEKVQQDITNEEQKLLKYYDKNSSSLFKSEEVSLPDCPSTKHVHYKSPHKILVQRNNTKVTEYSNVTLKEKIKSNFQNLSVSETINASDKLALKTTDIADDPLKLTCCPQAEVLCNTDSRTFGSFVLPVDRNDTPKRKDTSDDSLKLIIGPEDSCNNDSMLEYFEYPNVTTDLSPKSNEIFDDPLELIFCPETGVFRNKDGETFDSFGNPVDVSKPIEIPPDSNPVPQSTNVSETYDEPLPSYIYKNPKTVAHAKTKITVSQKLTNSKLLKAAISNIISLQGETVKSISYVKSVPFTVGSKKRVYVSAEGIGTIKDFPSAPILHMEETPPVEALQPNEDLPQIDNANEDLLEIKEEPLDIEENDLEPSLFPSDGETTRSASETSFQEKLAHETGFDHLLSSIPENDTEFDVPEYVHINHISFEDLTKLKQESEAYTRSLTDEKLVRNPMAELAKKQQPPQGKIAIPRIFQRKIATKGNAKTTKKRLRLVPVDPSDVVHTALPTPPKQRKISEVDKNVVLMMNFSKYGHYLNDHDYLISPYVKHNLMRRGRYLEKSCECQLCGNVHANTEHILHMETHDTRCKICQVDFHNVYVLNIHVKKHVKDCTVCGEKQLNYAELMIHESKHSQTLPKPEHKSLDTESDEEACIYDSSTNSYKTPSSMKKSLLESIKSKTKPPAKNSRRRFGIRRRRNRKLNNTDQHQSQNDPLQPQSQIEQLSQSHQPESPSAQLLTQSDQLCYDKLQSQSNQPELQSGQSQSQSDSLQPESDQLESQSDQPLPKSDELSLQCDELQSQSEHPKVHDDPQELNIDQPKLHSDKPESHSKFCTDQTDLHVNQGPSRHPDDIGDVKSVTDEKDEESDKDSKSKKMKDNKKDSSTGYRILRSALRSSIRNEVPVNLLGK